MLPGMAKLTTSHLIDLSAAPVPEWVELLPAGEFSGRDGRGPYVADTAQILAAFTAGAIPLPIDYEHQSLLAEDNGQPAPAAGWITEFDVRDRALWGHVEWTDRAAAHIAAREYRFLSPVFCYEQRTGVVQIQREVEGGPLVQQLPRAPGAREQRWMHLLCGPIDVAALQTASSPAAAAVSPFGSTVTRFSWTSTCQSGCTPIRSTCASPCRPLRSAAT